MACGVDNLQAQMVLEPGASAHTFDTGSIPIEFVSESLTRSSSLLRSESIRGTRQVELEQSRQGPYEDGGGINMVASAYLLRHWLEYALGEESGGTVTPAEALPAFGLLVDKVSDIVQFSDCKVNGLTLSAGGPGLVDLSVDVMALDYSEPATAFPTPTEDSNDASHFPLVFSDLTLTLGGTAYECNSFNLSIQNNIQRNIRNSLNAGCLRAGKQVITLTANVPSTSTAWSALSAPDILTGITGVVNLTNGVGAGDVSCVATLNNMQKAKSIPVVNGAGEQTFDVVFTATKTGSGDAISVVTDVNAGS